MANSKRYSGLTREQQRRRNQSASARRANSQFRTAADSGRGSNFVGDSTLKMVRYNTGAISNGSKIVRKFVDDAYKATRRKKYGDIRAAFGLSAG